MKLYHRIAVSILAAAVASCASVTEGLKDFNEGMSKVTGKPTNSGESGSPVTSKDGTPHESTLTYKGGGTRTIAFKVPAKHCAPDEYINKYERGYANRWNERINGRQTKYTGSKASADKESYAALEAKTLLLPKSLPLPSPEEIKRRDRLSADCTDIDGSPYAETQAFNDILAEFPE